MFLKAKKLPNIWLLYIIPLRIRGLPGPFSLEAACVVIEVALPDTLLTLLPLRLQLQVLLVGQDTAAAKLAIESLQKSRKSPK